MISSIAVIGKNRELGNENKLLWHIPGDLPRFHRITSGHPIIMGKNTHQSIGRVLPDRTNIVVSTTLQPKEGISTANSIQNALEIAEKSAGSDEIFVIGGQSIYEQTMAIVDRLYLTVVDAETKADTFFPDYSDFTKVISQESHSKGGFDYQFITLERP